MHTKALAETARAREERTHHQELQVNTKSTCIRPKMPVHAKHLHPPKDARTRKVPASAQKYPCTKTTVN